jgi:FkbM family methyltransferase
MPNQMIKQLLKNRLRHTCMYNRLKESFLYDVYWQIANPQIIEARSKEVAFYNALLQGLGRGDLIFDIGANHGSKTDIFLRLGARVVAVEPDEYCQNVLEYKFLKLRLANKPVTIVREAISDKRGTVEMWVENPGSAMNTLSQKWVNTLRNDGKRFQQIWNFQSQRKVQTTTLEDLIIRFGIPFFIKIDVEGYEPNVLMGLRHAVAYLSFEVNLPEFRPESLKCVELLERIQTGGHFNYATSCENGLELREWVGIEEIRNLLEACNHKSIEVFWNSNRIHVKHLS